MSGRSLTDPSSGAYEFKLIQGGLPEFALVWGCVEKLYTSGPKNAEIHTGMPYLKSNDDITFKVRNDVKFTLKKLLIL